MFCIGAVLNGIRSRTTRVANSDGVRVPRIIQNIRFVLLSRERISDGKKKKNAGFERVKGGFSRSVETLDGARKPTDNTATAHPRRCPEPRGCAQAHKKRAGRGTRIHKPQPTRPSGAPRGKRNRETAVRRSPMGEPEPSTTREKSKGGLPAWLDPCFFRCVVLRSYRGLRRRRGARSPGAVGLPSGATTEAPQTHPGVEPIESEEQVAKPVEVDRRSEQKRFRSCGCH